MVDMRTLHSREVMSSVRQGFGDKVYDTYISRTVKFPDATIAAQPITEYAPRTSGRRSVSPPGTRSDRQGAVRLSESDSAFAVTLDVFSGPFSVLLSLISKRRLDVTEVALAEVTDEFIAFICSHSVYNLSQASEFSVVAATLLDLKAARLLPGREELKKSSNLSSATCCSRSCCSTEPISARRSVSCALWRARHAHTLAMCRLILSLLG